MKNILIFLSLIFLISCEKDSYDYRDRIIGNYRCNCVYFEWEMGDTITDFITSIDTLTVLKANYNEIKIQTLISQLPDNIFPLDSNWRYSEHLGGSTSLKVQFFPDNDSVNYYKSNGGLGGGIVLECKGNNISN